MSNLEFAGKSVVITGAAAGMGKAITVKFLKNGATVVAVDINKSALDELDRELKEKYPEDIVKNFIPFVGDVSKQEVNEEMIAKAVSVIM